MLYYTNVEWTQLDFEFCINSVPSRSELDDIIETILRIHHKTVAKMQLEYHEDMKKLFASKKELAAGFFKNYEAGNMTEADGMAFGFIMEEAGRRARLLGLCIKTMSEVTKDRIIRAQEHWTAVTK